MKKLYCIRDVLAEDTYPIFGANNDHVAKKYFVDGITKNELKVEDFRLYHVGDFDETMMIIEASSSPREVII